MEFKFLNDFSKPENFSIIVHGEEMFPIYLCSVHICCVWTEPRAPLTNGQTNSEGEVSVILGEPVVLTCDVTGLPNPEIKWRRNGEVIRNRNVNHNIQSVTEEDIKSEFACNGSNALGYAVKTFKLKIVHRPTFFTITFYCFGGAFLAVVIYCLARFWLVRLFLVKIFGSLNPFNFLASKWIYIAQQLWGRNAGKFKPRPAAARTGQPVALQQNLRVSNRAP